jgi:hypothetical protein
MTDMNGPGDRTTRRIRRIARILSIILAGITLLIILANVFTTDPYEVDYPPVENLMPLSMVLSVVSLALAWRWEGVGGMLNIIFFLANLVIFQIVRGEFLPLGVIALLSPVIVPGILFLMCWRRSGTREAAAGLG